MDLGIAGKTALVTGASVGIGRSCAEHLAREGVNLVISARGGERLENTAEEIRRETGVRVVAVSADHGTREGRSTLLTACPEPDILVTCISSPRQTFDYREVTEEDWSDALASTLLGPVELMRATVEGMGQRGFGRVVNIGTIGAKYPLEMRILSGPPRSALINYAIALSKRVARDNVIINNILPGVVETEGLVEIIRFRAETSGVSFAEANDAFRDEFKIPRGRFGRPDEVGAMCAFFCSAHIGYTVGQNLVIDGGWINSLF